MKHSAITISTSMAMVSVLLACEQPSLYVAGKTVLVYPDSERTFLLGNDTKESGDCVRGQCEHLWTDLRHSEVLSGECFFHYWDRRVELVIERREAAMGGLNRLHVVFEGEAVLNSASLELVIGDELLAPGADTTCSGITFGGFVVNAVSDYQGHFAIVCNGLEGEGGPVDVDLALFLYGCTGL